MSKRAIERANKRASERLASERASVVVAVVGAAAATVTVRRPERVSKRAIERTSKRARERRASERAGERRAVSKNKASSLDALHRKMRDLNNCGQVTPAGRNLETQEWKASLSSYAQRVLQPLAVAREGRSRLPRAARVEPRACACAMCSSLLSNNWLYARLTENYRPYLMLAA